MPAFFPQSAVAALGDSVLLNRAIYGGNLELADTFLNDYDPARDPSNVGIRDALNVYDRYDTYLAQFGFQTLGANDLGFDPADVSFVDDSPTGGAGNGVDRNWFYDGDLYRNHVVTDANGMTSEFDNAAAVAIAAVKDEGSTKTLHLVFRGTDADLGSDGEAGTGPGQVRYYGQLQALINQARDYAADTANGITDVVVSGHSLGGSMVDMFALYDGASFDAIAGVDLTVVALASAGIDPVTLQMRPDYDTNIVTVGANGTTFTTPDWYVQYDNANDIVRNPETYDFAAHSQNDPQQAPQTQGAISTLQEHIEFTENRVSVESPFLDQYAAAATLETLFLPEHYSSYYELIGLGLQAASAFAPDLDYDRIIALGGQNQNILNTTGTNNANGFNVPENNFYNVAQETGDLLIMGLTGRDVIYSGSGADLLDGGSGNDVLRGGAGGDILVGGDGIDSVQYTDSASGQRVDLTFASRNNGDAAGDTFFSIENLRGSAFNDDLRGDAGANRIEGLAGNDALTGRAGDDVLIGGAGNDALRGDTGADVLNGGSGRDTAHYVFSATALRVDLQFAARNTGEAAGDTYINIENLRASAFGDDLRGDSGANRIDGLDGNDFLTGRDGDDILVGGEGNDVLRGDAGADILSGGFGIDLAQYAFSTTGLLADLKFEARNTGEAAGDDYRSIENLRGSAFDDDLRGDDGDNLVEGLAGNDYITGRGGDDLLRGGEGRDILVGGAGNDTLIGNEGIDYFRFAAPTDGVDTIIDLQINEDQIVLDDAGFTPLATGALSAANFQLGAVALDADDYILYDGSTVYYDADANGSGAAVAFAVLANGTALDADDFLIV